MAKCVEEEMEPLEPCEDPMLDMVKWPITEKMIIECLNEQLPTGEEGKYARMVKLDIRTVTFLKMEYKSISLIDNLSNMSALTKLQLCNNVILKIENLEPLVNLTWLDLSFNSITKIENLDSLRKLEVLNLHRNFITTLQNMDHLLRLEMFHISCNNLDNYENVQYLRRFIRLRSASFQGNILCKNPNFMHYLIAFVPQLAMVDYKAILSKDREAANAKYKAQIDRLVNTKDKLIRRASLVEAEEEVQLLHKDAFVDGFQDDRFWHFLFENDPEGRSIMQLSDTDDIQVMYQGLFKRATKDCFEKGMRVYEMRQNEVKAYNTAVKEELVKVQKAGNVLTEEFVEYGSHTLKDVRVLVSLMEDYKKRVQHGLAHDLPPEFSEFETQLNEIGREYVKKLHEIWSTLITNEIDFNEQIEDVNDLLDRSVREIIQNWQEQLNGQFGTLREVEQQLHGRLVEALVTYGEFRLSDTNIPADLKELVMDKDALMSHLQLSHDHHIAAVDGRKDQLSNLLKEWQENFSIELANSEYKRNHDRLSEIAHFTDTHFGYLEETRALQHTTVHIPSVRGDQQCVDPKECQPLQWYEKLTKRLRAKDKKFKASMQPRSNKKDKQELPSERPSFVL